MTMAKGRCESDPIACDSAAGNKPERRHQHGHHDGTKPQHRALDGGIHDRVPSRAELVDVLEHDDAGLHRDAEQRQEADSRGHAEVGARDQQSASNPPTRAMPR